LILEILYLGASRWGMLEARELMLPLKKTASSRLVYQH
jgi:hypothetical protein